MAHTPVLLHEVITGLMPQAGETYLDATVGSGGHALSVGKILGNKGRIIGLDQDQSSLESAKQILNGLTCRVDLIQANFRHLDQILTELKVTRIDRALFDLGVHSQQLGESGRGFSFRYDEPLLMTMDQTGENKLTARDIVNYWSKSDIDNVLTGYGEEQFAAAIAENITKTRRDQPLNTTFDLVRVIEQAVPAWYRRRRIHPATKTFQALRIVVNDELNALREGLERAFAALKPSGRLAVISFHSLEARIIKDTFKLLAKNRQAELITKPVIKPGWEEIKFNRRARSAQLRIIAKI